MRRVVVASVFSLIGSLLAMVLVAVPAAANEWRCFEPRDTWCAWTVRESRPDLGWGVVNKVRLPGLVVETIIDAQNNTPMLRVKLAPVPATEDARVYLSLRQDMSSPTRWLGFVAQMSAHEDGVASLELSRSALEAVIQAPDSAKLYVFVELRSKTTNHKTSHKVGIEGLRDALRFARLGR